MKREREEGGFVSIGESKRTHMHCKVSKNNGWLARHLQMVPSILRTTLARKALTRRVVLV